MATNWTDGRGNGDWYTAGNWNGGAPVNTANGTLQVTISGAIATQPTISPLDNGATDVINLTQSGTQYQDVQIEGQTISLINHADLVMQGAAIGLYKTDALGASITNLTAAPNTTTPSFDSHMVISATGTDILTLNDVNHNFGLLEATGAGNDLQITVAVGGNVQNPHALYNYGEILANAGATVSINVISPSTGDTTNFGNAGYIVVTGGTFATDTGVMDGANVQNAAGIPDGYIEIGSVGSALLLGTVAAKEEVVFLDGSHNLLEIANGNLFQGNVAGFQAGDTIQIQGVTASVSLSYSGSILSVAQLNSAGTVTATSTINIGTSYSATQFVDVFSTNGVNVITGNTSLTSTEGSIYIDYGQHVTLSNTSGVDTIPVTFGTHGSVSGPNILDINGTVAGTNSPYQGTITGFGANDVITLGPNVLPAATAGSSVAESFNPTTGVLTVTELNAGGTLIGTSTVTLAGDGSLTSASFVAIEGSNGVNIELASTQLTSTSGSIVIDYGHSVTLANTTGIDTVPVIFGTHGSVTGLNTLDINGTVTGTNSPYQGAISGFGLNDDIVIGTSVLPSLATGSAVSLSYAGSLLTVGEVNATGTVTATTTINVGTGYSTSSFVALLGTNGINIETPATVDEKPLTFTGTAGTVSSFEDPTKYTGGLAPGSSIVAGETVVIAAGTASITSTAPVVNSGTIIVSGTGSALLDTATLSGGGTVALANGGQVTLANTIGTDASQTIQFSTGATSLALNTLDLTGSTLGFAGTIAGFGVNDAIVLAGGVLPTVAIGSSVALSYAGSLLTVAELNSAGAVTASTTLNVGTGFSASSFVDLIGTNGVTIETAATAGEKPLTFSAAGTTTNFETPGAYAGGLAPGNTIVAGETVVVAAGTASITSTSPVSNSGTIIVSGTTSALIDAATLSGGGTIALANGGQVTLANATGTDAAQTIQFGTGGSPAALNGLDINGSTLGFAGTIAGFGANDVITLGPNVLPAATAGSSVAESFNPTTGVLTVTELNAGGTLIGTSTVTLAGDGSLTSASFVAIEGSNGVNIELASTQLTSTSGSIVIDYGHSVTLANTTGIDTVPVIFGTHGSVTGLNTLDINGTVTGTNSPYQGAISGFGLNDDIVIGQSVLPSLASSSEVTLSYAGSLLSVSEFNATGTVTATTTINVGTGYSTSSFVALLGTNGINIETPATVDEKPLTFTGTAGTVSSFEDPTKYAGGLAPGSSIVAGETVIIAAGTASIASTSPVANSGTIIIAGTSSALIDTATLSGAGTLAISTGGHVTLANTTGVDTGTVYFGTGGTATNPNLLDLTGTGTLSFGGTIANFGTFDTIVLGTSVLPGTETSFSTLVSGGLETLTVTSSVNGTIHTDQITFASPPPGVFVVTNSPNGIIIADLPCFASGTRILTGSGQVAVESLKAGDKVLSARTGKLAEVVWVGSRSLDLTRHAMPEKVRPIRIIAGAFADALPERDLIVSPDHALFIDGHLIEAKTLVNGVTILQDKAIRFITYHHVELAAHDIMLAEGLAAESFLDSGNRAMFETDAAPMMLHPDFAAAARSKACAKLLTDGDIVITARARLLIRAIELGFNMTDKVEVTAIAAGHTIQPSINGRELVFVLPAGATSVELLSAAGVPAETTPAPGDRRVLGLAISGLALVTGGQRITIALDNPAHTGFHAMEIGHRWTNGAACIALPAYSGRAVLEVTINGQAKRWISAA